MILVTISHISLALGLFFGINLLGQYSPSSFNYYQLTTFLETEEAPAFNFVVRVLTPVVFIILVSAVFYSFKLDKFTVDIYLVNLYYVIFRGVFNILINRFLLINWVKYIVHSLIIVSITYFVYEKFILTKTNLLPDFDNMANELWIIIIVFIYNFINQLKPSDKNKQRRKDRYIRTQFAVLNRKYSPVIRKETDNVRLRQIALAIVIYESFNRPAFLRLFEYITHFFSRRPHSLGIMQVTSKKFIGNKESVKLGTQKLCRDFETLKLEYKNDKEVSDSPYYDDFYQQKLIEKFNPDITYSYEVLQLADEINTKYFNNLPKNLFNNRTLIE
jgi:hypothetical protein